MSLEERYARDPELLAFYCKRLLEPGWAGELGPDELAYIKSELKQSASLRRRWFFLAALVSSIFVASCGRGRGTAPARTSAPTSARAPTPALTPVSTPTPSSADVSQVEIRDYLALVFPPGPGRDEVFQFCANCHGIQVMIFSGPSKDEGGWQLTRRNHAMLLGDMGEMDGAWNYVLDHFGSHRTPPPPPPQGLVAGWQNYL